MHHKLKAPRAMKTLLNSVQEAAENYPPIPRMTAKSSPPSPLNQVKSRKIDFVGFREKDGKRYCMISASQLWTDEYFAELDAKNPGPRGTPKGEQWKMLILYDEVMAFLEAIKEQGKG